MVETWKECKTYCWKQNFKDVDGKMVDSWEELKTYCWKLLQYSEEICNLIVTIDQRSHANYIDYPKENLLDTIHNVFRIKEEMAKLLQVELEKQNGN